MANCDHDEVGICKSCRQTIREGGTVAVHRTPTPPSEKVAEAKKK